MILEISVIEFVVSVPFENNSGAESCGAIIKGLQNSRRKFRLYLSNNKSQL